MARRGKERRKDRTAGAVPEENATRRAAPGSWPVGAIAAALGLLLYANTLGHGYVLDDHSAIKENWIVKSGLNAESIGLILTTEYRHGSGSGSGSLYRPMPLLMFAAEWPLSPDDPRVGHLVNVLLYALTGWLLWVTLRRVLSKQPPALVAMAVLLFMAHPVHTEVVANIKGRDEILSLLFGTATLYTVWRHLDKGSVYWLASAVLLYVLALFSKESAITLLAVVPLTIWFFHPAPASRNLSHAAKASANACAKASASAHGARVSLVLLVPAIAYLVIRGSVVGPQAHLGAYTPLDVVYLATDDRMERLATAFMMGGRHLWALVFPHTLVSDMGYPQVVPVGFGDWRALTGLAVCAGLLAWALAGLRGKRFSSWAVLFCLITFSVAANVLVLVSTYGERLLYLPSLGFTLLLAHGLSRLVRIDDMRSVWDPNGRGALFWGAATAVLALYGVRTVTRNADWRTGLSLFSADLPKSPNSAMLNHNLGIEAYRAGVDGTGSVVRDTARVMEGIAAQTRAIGLYPRYPDALAARGLCRLLLSEHEAAEKDLRAALTLRWNDAMALSNLAIVQCHAERYAEAEALLGEAIRADPRMAAPRRILGGLLAMRGQYREAIVQWKEGLRYDPRNGELHFLIGTAHGELGEDHLAVQWLGKARALGVDG